MEAMEMRFVDHVARMWQNMNACKIFVRKPDGRCPLELLWRRSEVVIKMYLKYGEAVDLRVIRVASGSIKCV